MKKYKIIFGICMLLLISGCIENYRCVRYCEECNEDEFCRPVEFTECYSYPYTCNSYGERTESVGNITLNKTNWVLNET